MREVKKGRFENDIMDCMAWKDVNCDLSRAIIAVV